MSEPYQYSTERFVSFLQRDGWLIGFFFGMGTILIFNNGWLFVPGGLLAMTLAWYHETDRIHLKTIGWIAVLVILAAIYVRGEAFVKNMSDYEGIVSEQKQFKSGFAIDLDGEYPNQKMTVFIPASAYGNFRFVPEIGDKISVRGTKTIYSGHPEIIVTQQSGITREASD